MPTPSPPGTTPDSRRIAAGAAFRHRDFRRYQAARLLATVGTQVQGVAVGWQVYALTHQPIALGYVGLAQFLPSVLLWLWTGHTADRFDRRTVLVVSHGVLCVAAAALYALSRSPSPPLAGIYAVLVTIGVARAFLGPASQALVPNLVPEQHFANAVAWSASIRQVAVVAGPALGGVLYGLAGARGAYATTACLEASAVAILTSIATRARNGPPEASSWGRLLAGVRYVRAHPILLGAISLDLFAILLGGAVALLPIYAQDILHTGPLGLGLLRSAPAAGAALVAIWLAYQPLRRRAGRSLLLCVFLFGVSTIVFGLSKSFPVSACALGIGGGADMVSVYVRSTLVQLRTPDAMRGRVSAVNQIFVGTSNELGEFESGVTAAWLGTVPAVVVGGLGTCLVVLLWARFFPDLGAVDRLEGG
jgi:MFS family permease